MPTTTRSLRFSVLALATALAGGCDDGAGGRGGSGQPGSGGKADDTNTGVPVSGPAVVRIVLAADPLATEDVDTVDFQLYWGDEVDPDNRVKLHEEFATNLTGKDCLTIVSENPARSIHKQEREFITRSCDLGLVPDPDNVSVLSLPTVTMSLTDLPVDFGAEFELIGLGGESVVAEGPGGFHGLPVDETFVFAPGDYTIKLGHDASLGFETMPHTWQLADVSFGQADDFRGGFDFQSDPRIQIFIDAPDDKSSLPAATAASQCQLGTEAWVTTQTDSRSYKRELDEDQELYFMPYAGAQYVIRVAGLLQWNDGRLPNGQFIGDAEIPLYLHEVPVGPDGANGTYRIDKIEDKDEHAVSCQGTNNPNATRNATFELGTHMLLPAGQYRETVTYTGEDPVERVFELRG